MFRVKRTKSRDFSALPLRLFKRGLKESLDHDYVIDGRFIGIPLLFPTISPKGKVVKNKYTKLFISSIYHPWELEIYDEFNSLTSTLLSKAPENSVNIVGHDLNASVGTRNPEDSEEVNNVVGPVGFNNRNEKGGQAISFLLQMDLRVMTTYFNHENYTTHTSNLTSPPTPSTLDSISISSNGVKKVKDCKVCKLGVL
eukprot:scaffold75760_cov60-Cyclotella_meneghiniana.AAC.14